MDHTLKRISSLLMALIMLTLCACGAVTDQTETSSEAVSEETRSVSAAETAAFAEYTNKLFIYLVTSDPITLAYTLSDPEAYGITDTYITLSPIDTDDPSLDYTDYYGFLSELYTFDYSSLSDEDQLTYDVLEEYLTTFIAGEEFLWEEELFGPYSGLQSYIPIELAEYAIESEDDIETYLSLLSDIYDYLVSAADFEVMRAAQGYVMPSSAISEVIEACEEFINAGDDNLLLTSFEERLSALSLSDADLASYTEQNRQLVEEQVIPAFIYIVETLESIDGTGTNSQGLCYYENGTAYYEWLIDYMIGSSYSCEELMSLILDRIDSQLLDLYTLLYNDSSLYTQYLEYSDERTPEEILEALQEAISEDYPALQTDAVYEIKYVPSSLESMTSPAFYMIPPIDSPDENVIYINESSTDSSSIFSTLAHEGYPGHLYQTVYSAYALSDPVRRLTEYVGYTEGWGLYVEFESYYMDTTISEDLAGVLSLNSSIVLGVYAYLDLGIHYAGWTMDEAKAVMTEYFGELDADTVASVYNTIVSEPAYYLKYYVGYLELILMREEAESVLGGDFSLLEFHTFILDIGSCAFCVINEYFDEWLYG